MRKTKWSVSRLQNYAKCGKAYELEKILRTPQRQAGWFIQGSAVHYAILESYEASGRAMEIPDALEAFDWSWNNELEKARELQPSDNMWMRGGRKGVQKDLEDRYALGRSQVIDYIEKNPVDGLWAPFEIVPGEFSVEVGFEISFGEVTVIGFIDAIEENRQTGAWKVQDLKTGTKVPTDPYQMKTYGLSVERLFGVKVTHGDWWMCKDGGESDPFDMTKFTDEEVKDWYKALARGIENRVFIANPGDCFTCSVLPWCKYGAKNPLPWPPQEAPS